MAVPAKLDELHLRNMAESWADSPESRNGQWLPHNSGLPFTTPIKAGFPMTNLLRALSLIFILLLGCGGPIGEVGLQSVEKDKAIGKELHQVITTEMGEIKQPALNAYVNRIGIRVLKQVSNRRFRYQFSIIDQAEPNAFAVPGGYIYISRGLLALVNSEEELANILAHEIIHVNKRHIAKQLAKQTLPNLFQLPGMIVGDVIGGQLGQVIKSPFQAVSLAYMTRNSRLNEHESDQLGIQLSAQAGYNPASLGIILKSLEDEDKLRPSSDSRPDFFATHPSTPKRVKEINQFAAQINWRKIPGFARSKAGFLKNFDGMMVGPNPEEGILVKNKFLHPELDIYIAFPKGWLTVNKRHSIGSLAPDQDGLLVMGTPKKGTDPEKTGKALVIQFINANRIKPTRSQNVQINGRRAYLVTFGDRTDREPVFIQLLWIEDRGAIYPFFGLAKERHQTVLKEATFSFRSLTPADKVLIKEKRLKIVMAKKGELLDQLSKRLGNIWDSKTTAIFNGIPIDQPLKEGQIIKIAVSRPYPFKKR